MSSPMKPHFYSESTSEPSLDGKKMERSKRSKHRQDKDGMISTPIQENSLLQLERPLFMPVSAAEDNQKTSQGKSKSSKKSTRKRKSSAKSAADSTSKGRNLMPYWNESCQEMSQQLWSLTKIDLPDLDLIGLTGSAKSLNAQSWFSMKLISLLKQRWLKTFSPSSTASQADCMDSGSTKLRSRKIKIYPSP